MKAPILLVVWRRPQTTRLVLDAIRAYAPERLYVASDGANPERPGESAKVEATRALIDQGIDWDCRVERLYSTVNQGCRLSMSRAITWFFEQEEEGLIFEDDCVPHPNFFPYCERLLEHFRNDERVWCIGGSNFQDGRWRGDGSYYFSRYPHCWGWASWRRCWQHYDDALSLWPKIRASGLLETVFPNPVEKRYWTEVWDKLYYSNTPDSWAYRWTLTVISMGGLTVLPNRNLISNIGFGEDATHTTDGRVTHQMQGGISELVHPSFLVIDREADAYTFHHHIAGKFLRYKSSFKGLLFDPLVQRFKIAFKNPTHYPQKIFDRFFASR